MATTTLPVEGNRAFVAAVRRLAEERGVLMATLVREAVDKVHGPELEPLVTFFESRDARNHHSEPVNTGRAGTNANAQ